MKVKKAGTMKILNRKLWIGTVVLMTITLTSGAAIAGGFEWALAALGAMTLAGMIGAGIYVYMRVRRYSKALKVASPESGAEAKPISNKDKTSIMKHLDELFETEQGQSEEEFAGDKPISSKDKRLIIANIDEFFEAASKQNEKNPAIPELISEEDKRLIMAHIDRLFDTDGEQNKHILA